MPRKSVHTLLEFTLRHTHRAQAAAQALDPEGLRRVVVFLPRNVSLVQVRLMSPASDKARLYAMSEGSGYPQHLSQGCCSFPPAFVLKRLGIHGRWQQQFRRARPARWSVPCCRLGMPASSRLSQYTLTMCQHVLLSLLCPVLLAISRPPPQFPCHWIVRWGPTLVP